MNIDLIDLNKLSADRFRSVDRLDLPPPAAIDPGPLPAAMPELSLSLAASLLSNRWSPDSKDRREGEVGSVVVTGTVNARRINCEGATGFAVSTLSCIIAVPCSLRFGLTPSLETRVEVGEELARLLLFSDVTVLEIGGAENLCRWRGGRVSRFVTGPGGVD